MNCSFTNKAIAVLLSLALMGIVAMAGCFSDNKNMSVGQHLASAQLLPAAKPMEAFSLETQRGESWTAESFQSYWNLVIFGFTSCPDICPMGLHQLTRLLQLAESYRTDVRVVFISLDPERDSREKIDGYLASFNRQIIGLRGSNAELAKVSHFFAADYSRHAVLSEHTAIAEAGTALNIPAGIDMPFNVDQNYQVEHSPRIYVIDPRGDYIGSFVPPFKAEQMWNELQVIIKR